MATDLAPIVPHLAERLIDAVQRRDKWRPPFSQGQIDRLGQRTDLLGRIARGLGRANVIAKKYGRPWLIADISRAKITRDGGWDGDPEQLLIDICGALAYRPHEWIVFAVPYYEPGDFKKAKGLRKWQAEVVEDIGTTLQAQVDVSDYDAIRRAIGSGHGVGKTGMSSLFILWSMSTSPDCRIIALANTEEQLKKRNWPELMKFKRACITSHWFTLTGKQMHVLDEEHKSTWHTDACVWDPNRLTSIQGLHQGGGDKRIVVITDESSTHPPELWDTLSGVLLDQNVEVIWLALGNPTHATGPFFDALKDNKLAHIWKPKFVDARTVEEMNQKQIERSIEEHGGLDSDWVRVRVLGQPPQSGDINFFNRLEVEAAMDRVPSVPDPGYPLIIGVDVARFGHDASVIFFRRHMDARSFDPIKLRHLDNMQLAQRVALIATHMRQQLNLRVIIVVDGTGFGSGVVDRLKEMNYTVVDCVYSAKAPDPLMYSNVRAHMHGLLRDAIKHGLAIPRDRRLLDEMVELQYGHALSGAIQLERKEDLKARLGYSPDELDALAMTFGAPVSVIDKQAQQESRDDIWTREGRRALRDKAHGGSIPEYNPYDKIGSDA